MNLSEELKEEEPNIPKEIIDKIQSWINENEEDMLAYTICGLESLLKKLKIEYKIK